MEFPDGAILAFDLGTSGLKAALVSVKGKINHWTTEPVSLTLLPQGGAEQDPRQWWDALCKATRKLLTIASEANRNILAVCCTAQWSGTVAVDADGNPIGNAIICMDTRGEPYARRITSGFPKVEGYGLGKLIRWIRLTGGAPGLSGKDPVAHVLYLKNRVPETYDRTSCFLEPKDYLNLRLTGKPAASIDSITLYWVTDNRDLNDIHYEDRLLKLTGLDRNRLPHLKRSTEILGPLTPEAARDLGLKEGIPVLVGSPDIHSAAIGSGAVHNGEAHLYVGTSSWIAAHVPFKKTDLLHNMASLPSALPGKYLLVNEQVSAGVCLTWLKKNLFPERASPGFEDLDKMAEAAPPGSGDVVFTPWLYGERSPVSDRTLRGGFHNLSLDTTRSHLVRSVYEGVAYNSRWLLESVERFLGRRITSLRIAGGGASSDVWCQIYADILNRSVIPVKEPVLATVRGAGLLAAYALGRISLEEIPRCVETNSHVSPISENRDLYDRLFREFKRIYTSNRKIYASLNPCNGNPLKGEE